MSVISGIPHKGGIWLVGFDVAQRAHGRSEKTRVAYGRELLLLIDTPQKHTPTRLAIVSPDGIGIKPEDIA